MTAVSLPRIMIAAPSSGGGKTTVMCALLGVLRRQHVQAAAFKSGPDYIDPMFHRRVLHTPSRNLDLFLLGGGEEGRNKARYLLARGARQASLAVLEGAMGYYDGIGTGMEGSAYELARATDTPVLLVVDGKGVGISLAAQIQGLARFRRDSGIAGFIVNRVSPMVYAYFKDRWEAETGLPALGYLPEKKEWTVPSRHLGLVTAGELTALQDQMADLACTAEKSLQIQEIRQIAGAALPLSYEPISIRPVGPARIAVAQDEAFCFYYADSLDLLKQLGAELVFFSPLRDSCLPPCDGLYLGGGYPELYARKLSENTAMGQSIRRALARRLPCIAECGGFMYLQEGFCDSTGDKVPWVGAIPGQSHMTRRLQRFGYVTLTAQEDTMLCQSGEQIHAHEFHYSDSTNNGQAFMAQKAAGPRHWPCIYSTDRLVAGYPHWHFWGNPHWAARFVQACRAYRKEEDHEDGTCAACRH